MWYNAIGEKRLWKQGLFLCSPIKVLLHNLSPVGFFATFSPAGDLLLLEVIEMANPNNLIPGAHTLTVEEQSRGGKASGEARRKRKTLREELLAMLEDPEIQKGVTAALMKNALDGDNKAFEILRDTIGEKPKDILDINSNEIRIKIDD